jgi:hypothetical protein
MKHRGIFSSMFSYERSSYLKRNHAPTPWMHKFVDLGLFVPYERQEARTSKSKRNGIDPDRHVVPLLATRSS